MPVPIIDLFGPGGLGKDLPCRAKQQPFFEIALPLKRMLSHRTLTLRAVFRRLRGTKDVKHYYSYIQGEIDEPLSAGSCRTAPSSMLPPGGCLGLASPTHQYRQGNSCCTEGAGNLC